MSQTTSASDASLLSRLGTFMVIPWSGENHQDGRDMAFLMAYTLGDGAEGPAGSEAAALAVAEEAGLPVGGAILDVAQTPRSPVKLLVEGGKAVLTMPHLHVACAVPDEWTAAARDRGTVYVILASRPWPQAVPGRQITEDDLKAFISDETALTSAAHCFVPVSSLMS
ncbi:DUF5949 family protein [Streptomyces sp. NPDC021020]|uniref:DUF5949 family protein n=1 Tax=Streptomyces sp. NPDC021020 TaxID=3365109 RepID=UPI0037922026